MKLQRKGLCLLLHVIVATCAREPSSQACSRYDYEERLLERVLRNELALETTLNEIMKTNAKVVDALTQLEDGKAKVQSALIIMEQKQNEIGLRMNELFTNASHVINLTLAANVDAMVQTLSVIKGNASETLQQLVKEVNVLKDQLQVPSIYFLARITTTTTDLSDNKDVVFPTVEINKGQGYDPSTGKFTSSISGMYLFSVQYCVPTDKGAYLGIVKNGTVIQGSVHSDKSGHYTCVTMQVASLVAKGDTIWVRTTGTSTLRADGHRSTSFFGTLINL